MATQAEGTRKVSQKGKPWTERPASATGGGRIPWAWFLALLAVCYLAFSLLFPGGGRQAEVSYTFFEEQARDGNVAEVYARGDSVEGRFEKPVAAPSEGAGGQQGAAGGLFGGSRQPEPVETFATTVPSFSDPGLEGLLTDRGVEINSEPVESGGGWWPTLLFFGPVLLLIGLYAWFLRRTRRQARGGPGGRTGAMGGLGGALGLGRSNARRYDEETETRVTFEDVAGIDEAENELVEIVEFLKAPAKYTRLGGAAPKGVLLVGSPGTGKTLLAKAVAGEAGVPFFSLSASEFVEIIVGVGASRVRDLFKQARESAPAIVFVDELDAIGRARGRAAVSGGNSEQEQTLNQILTEMDGFSSREGVIVLAATNQPEVLDQALLRPGRFDRRVVVQAPDRRGREEILRVHTRGTPLSGDVDLQEIASSTPGLVGADLKNLVNEAALLAARRERDSVTEADFLDSLEKITLGPERHLLLDEETRRRIAYHEAGHAVLGLVISEADPVNRVTIVPRGQALGVTYQRPDDDRYNLTEGYLRARLVGALGGRAAEEIVYGSRTTGAAGDIDQVTDLARLMVTRWGMSDRLGMISYAPRDGDFLAASGAGTSRAFGEGTAGAIDEEVHRIVSESHRKARSLLTEHRDKLDALAGALLERETLDEEEVLAVAGLAGSTAAVAGGG